VRSSPQITPCPFTFHQPCRKRLNSVSSLLHILECDEIDPSPLSGRWPVSIASLPFWPWCVWAGLLPLFKMPGRAGFLLGWTLPLFSLLFHFGVSERPRGECNPPLIGLGKGSTCFPGLVHSEVTCVRFPDDFLQVGREALLCFFSSVPVRVIGFSFFFFDRACGLPLSWNNFWTCSAAVGPCVFPTHMDVAARAFPVGTRQHPGWRFFAFFCTAWRNPVTTVHISRGFRNFADGRLPFTTGVVNSVDDW